MPTPVSASALGPQSLTLDAFPPSPRRAFPQRFGRYILLAPIASGGMAEVFVAELTGPHGFSRRVALKRIHAHLAQEGGFIQSFLDEARLGACLRHPHVVQIQDLELIDSVPVAAMEYVEGGHFGSLLARGRTLSQPIPVPFVVELILQVARGLEHAHAAHDPSGNPLCLVHRDLKPSNLLLGLDGSARIVDFGIARASSNLTQTAPDVIKGSIPYMAPEQASGDSLSSVSDLFSLGAVLYELLTLERLHQGASQAGLLLRAALGPSPEALARLDDLPLEALCLAPILRTLLSPAPKDRFASASALISALEETGHTPISPARMARLAREWLSEVRPPELPSLERLQAFRVSLGVGGVKALGGALRSTPTPPTGSTASPPTGHIDPGLLEPDVPDPEGLEREVLEPEGLERVRPAPTGSVLLPLSAVEVTLAEGLGRVSASAKKDVGESPVIPRTSRASDNPEGLTATPLLLVRPSSSGLDVPIHTGQTSPSAEPWGTAPLRLAPEDVTGPALELVPGRLVEASERLPAYDAPALEVDEAPVLSQELLLPGMLQAGMRSRTRSRTSGPVTSGARPTLAPPTLARPALAPALPDASTLEPAARGRPTPFWVRPALILVVTLGILVWGGAQVWRLSAQPPATEGPPPGWIYVLAPAQAQVWLEPVSPEGAGSEAVSPASHTLGQGPLRFLPPSQARVRLRVQPPGQPPQALELTPQPHPQVVMASQEGRLELHPLSPEAPAKEVLP